MRVGPALTAAAGIAALCAMDAVVKYLTLSHAVLLVVVGRYVFGAAFAAAVWWAAGRPPITRAMLPAHLARGAAIAVCAFLFYWSLTRLTLAEALVVSFSAPLIIPLLARVLLGERLRLRNVLAGLIGFGGVLIAVGGVGGGAGGDERLLGALACSGAAVTYALAVVIMRARAASDGASVLTLFGAVVPLLFLSPFLVLLTPAERALPDIAALGWFAVVGLLGNLGVQLLARAYAKADAQTLAPLEFTGLLWAALFGWVFFNEPVSVWTWLGGAVIAGACLWSARAPSTVPEPVGGTA